MMQQLWTTCNSLICCNTGLIRGWYIAQCRYSTRFAAVLCSLKLRQKEQQKRATCFEKLLQNEVKSDFAQSEERTMFFSLVWKIQCCPSSFNNKMTLNPERRKAMVLKLSLFTEGVALPLVDTVDFRLPLAKRNYGKQRLFYQWAKEWNI